MNILTQEEPKAGKLAMGDALVHMYIYVHNFACIACI